jgi:proteic killer suppression protein
VIANFAGRKTEQLWQRRRDHGLPPQTERAALRKLTQLERSRERRDLSLPPGNRLEALKGKRAGQHGIRVNDQWRICFRWHGEDAHDVEIVDHH